MIEVTRNKILSIGVTLKPITYSEDLLGVGKTVQYKGLINEGSTCYMNSLL